MGPKDLERHLETKERHEEEKGKEKQNHESHTKRFEKLKAEKFGKKEDMSSAEMLEWIDLNKQIRFDTNTGKPYEITASDKAKEMIFKNPLIPLGNIDQCKYKL